MNKNKNENATPPDTTPGFSLLLARPALRWLVSMICGFFPAAAIVNLALPVIVEFDLPHWFMSTFPVLGGPILWILFSFATNHLIRVLSNNPRSGRRGP